MDPAEYDLVASLFLDVCDLPPPDREAVLDARTAAHPSIRAAVLRLLECDPVPGGLLTPDGYPQEASTRVPPLRHPERIGPYRLLEVLGEGGMGVVYLAEQEEPIRRRVALKWIKAGLDTREVVARFEAERQALAFLDHPHIAKVHEAGTTPEGRPYFVMELVRGLPISEFCDSHRLDVRERLGLLLQVCDAVEHAHGRGIIHRDLKPSNILVRKDDSSKPTCKVIDFGIAKAIDQSLTDKTCHTATGRPMGTLAYMSPEQARMSAEGVDHRTDVYALGVILYELLVGEPPIDMKSSLLSLEEMLRRLRTEEPPTPSVAWTRLNPARLEDLAAKRSIRPGALGTLLGRDLDWIVLKAIEKERKRRYSSAADLARDIRRCLADEPVTARPPSVAYKLRKYVRKNRWPVGAAAGIVLALALGLVASLVLYGRTEVARRISEERRAEVLRLSDVKLLAELRAEAEKLLVVSPGKRRAMEAWIEKARSLSGHLEEHRATLETLRGGGGEEEDLADSRAAAVGDHTDPGRIPNTALEWQHDLLVEVVEELKILRDPDPTKPSIARVLRWLELTPGDDAIDEAWAKAIASIRNPSECPKYRGLTLARQEHLIPLGRNPESGLWEFSDEATGLPPLGLVGSWTIAPETGLVFVLLPGGSFTMGSPLGECWRVKATIEGRLSAFESSLSKEGFDLLTRGNRLLKERKTSPWLGALLQACCAFLSRSMQEPGNDPQHVVDLSPFFLSKYETTQRVWSRNMGVDPSLDCGPDMPVHFVPWEDCSRLCLDMGWSIPTEAQWEYACRGGKHGPFAGSGRLEDVTWYEALPRGIRPVGGKRGNDFGLHDMHGNVWEWCRDWYRDDFYDTPEATRLDPEVDPGCSATSFKVIRGGCWAEPPWRWRSGAREGWARERASPSIGFRPARVVSK